VKIHLLRAVDEISGNFLKRDNLLAAEGDPDATDLVLLLCALLKFCTKNGSFISLGHS
jgi:hypothetical protein